jgi:hypothetical protein
VYLESFATTLGSREQLAIGEFANAALVIPKTLAVNAAKDATVSWLLAHVCMRCGCMPLWLSLGDANGLDHRCKISSVHKHTHVRTHAHARTRTHIHTL